MKVMYALPSLTESPKTVLRCKIIHNFQTYFILSKSIKTQKNKSRNESQLSRPYKICQYPQVILGVFLFSDNLKCLSEPPF